MHGTQITLDEFSAQLEEMRARHITGEAPEKREPISAAEQIAGISADTFPRCYTCVHAIRRGIFRLCDAGCSGYRHRGDVLVLCQKYTRVPETPEDSRPMN